MTAKDVQVGKVYAARVSGRIVPVRIIAIQARRWDRRQEWTGTNLVTERSIDITSARLRYETVEAIR